MTEQEKIELARLETERKIAFYGTVFKCGLGFGVVVAWVYSTVAGVVATAVLMGFLDSKSKVDSVNTNTAQQRYYELRSLQILDDE